MSKGSINWTFPHPRPYWGEKDKPKKEPKVIKDCQIICELPEGSSVMALDGRLIACHPNHNPIFIGMGNNAPLTEPSEGRGSTLKTSGIVGHGDKRQ